MFLCLSVVTLDLKVRTYPFPEERVTMVRRTYQNTLTYIPKTINNEKKLIPKSLRGCFKIDIKFNKSLNETKVKGIIHKKKNSLQC